MSEEEPKIIVDEDWKAQVEREKEELREQEAKAASTGDGEQDIPPASMPMLVSMLSTQAMMAMGLMPGPDGQPPQPNLPMAKHFIDLLVVLEEKTQGNLSDEESKMLTESVHQFRMAYVQIKNSPAADGPGDDQPPTSTIELP